MNIDTPESRKRARALLLLGLDAIDAFDREQKWADDRGRFSQEIADRRRAEARVRGEELTGRFNALKREYESAMFFQPCKLQPETLSLISVYEMAKCGFQWMPHEPS